jgi:hypothetical protein
MLRGFSRPLQEANPLTSDQRFASFCRGAFRAELEHFTANTLPNNILQWAVQLTGRNIGHLYEKTWGWNPESKLEELGHVRCAACTRD